MQTKKSKLSPDTFMSRIFINRSVSLIGLETETFYHYIIRPRYLDHRVFIRHPVVVLYSHNVLNTDT